ncbi:hypothetical protein FNF31_05684 [Cafeteria roenbergensis]|uniref:Uncharacterized protein n=1 Tax=Cafeteria roenbergensis TaxID=33653 RepID=A0A5A8D1N6_CAFRO|nr:hypothetical protein FNF31_05684 [Cafeteria roenbergensis]
MSQAGFQEPGFQQGVSLAARSITLRLQRHAGRGPEEDAAAIDNRMLPVPGERFAVPAGVLSRLRKRSKYKRLTAARVWHSMEVLPHGPAPSGLVGEALAQLTEQRAERDRIASEAEKERDMATFAALRARERGEVAWAPDSQGAAAEPDAMARATRNRLEAEGRAALATLSAATLPAAQGSRRDAARARLRQAVRSVAAASSLAATASGAVASEFQASDSLSSTRPAMEELASAQRAAARSAASSADPSEAVLRQFLEADARGTAASAAFRRSLEPRSNFRTSAYRPGKGSHRQALLRRPGRQAPSPTEGGPAEPLGRHRAGPYAAWAQRALR